MVKKKNKSKNIEMVSKTSDKTEESNKVEVAINELKEDFQQMENDSNMLIITGKKSNKNEDKNDKNGDVPKKKKLSRKERIKLEKIVERKNKSSRRNDLLEKLASVQINQNELKLYSSVKDIGKKEKRKFDDDLKIAEKEGDKQIYLSSIAGSNKKRVKSNNEKQDEDNDDNKSIDTDEMSTDSEIDDNKINEALSNYKKMHSEKCLEEFKKNYKANKIEDSGDEEEEKNNQESKNSEKNTINSNSMRKTKYVHVDRRDDIKEVRSKLPIITEEQLIMEKINENDISIICGETGSGKTTQVPQFLYEAGYAEDGYMIGITEPRRVAAISMCKRVNDEMNFKEEDSIVSYQIRYEGNYSPNTKLKFMTDGVLLKEVQTDFMLTKYSAIIIDEAHERSVYTDILIGLLSRIVPLRNKRGNPLKLIIMSATLRVEDFTDNSRLFKIKPPVIKVDSRQFPVSIHFNKNTFSDYLAEAYRKVCKIHRRLPEGGILVFVTGQQEVNVLCNKLRKTFPKYDKSTNNLKEENSNQEFNKDDNDNNDSKSKRIKKSRKKNDNGEKKSETKVELNSAPKVNLDSYSTLPLDEEVDLFESNNNPNHDEEENLDELYDLNNEDYNEEEIDDESDEDEDDPLNQQKVPSQKSSAEKPLYVLPLYSLLPSEKQIKVFDKVPEDARLCVVATNIAETSLTIPNIKYVVDCGKIKMKFYDKVTGVSTFRVCWTSKASADQRSGRAGRTSPGHCYRLYSSAVFNDEFPKFSEPEIVRKPVEDLILQMKDLGIDRIINFPYPTPPDETSVKVAENLLIQLGALEVDKKKIKNMRDEQITTITKLGKTMANFPINPRYSKMICLASQQNENSDIKNIISYIVCLISGLSIPELFIDGETTITKEIKVNTTNEKQIEHIKVKYSQLRQSWLESIPGSHTHQLGDLMLLLVALGAVEYEQHVNSTIKSNDEKCMKFCEQYGIRYKAIVEARKLRKQLVNTVNLVFPNLNMVIDPLISPPTQEQAKLLRQIILSGMVDKIAKRYEHAITDKEGKEIKNAYQGLLLEEPIFIHPSSVLFKDLPAYVCYVEMVETSKLYMKGVCSIDCKWLPIYLSNQCAFDKPLISEADENYESYKPRYDESRDMIVCHRESTFGRVMWKIKPVEVEFPVTQDLYKWFARFFLEGIIFKNLKKYESVLLASSTTMLKSWAKLQPRTESLLNALINNNCYTRKKLIEIWSKQPDFLLNEYVMWLPESLHFEIRLKWPPIDNN